MDKVGVVFPGQGSQYVGMGRDIFLHFREGRDTFEEASDTLGFDMGTLCMEGPREKLDLTVHTQTTVLTAAVAAYRVLKNRTGVAPAVLAGHSLGEYGALCAAGAIAFTDALRLVQIRGTLQQEAVPPGSGAMAALMGVERETIESICRASSAEGEGIVELTSFNAPGQYVVSGHAEAVDRLIREAKSKGGGMAVRLPISVPCHSSLLREAAERFREILSDVRIGDCSIPVIPNCNPQALHERGTARDLLVRQIHSPVRWQETVERMAGMEIRTIVETGPKKVLSGLIRRIDRNLRIANVEDRAGLEMTAALLEGS
jgi:[acyl-carrier-protein] S-malonyltransferase